MNFNFIRKMFLQQQVFKMKLQVYPEGERLIFLLSKQNRRNTPMLKGQQREIFWSRFSSWIYSKWASDFEAKGIYFSPSFSRSYQNILMNPRCRLLRGFKISPGAYFAYCHSPMQPIALLYKIIFPYKTALQATAAIQNQRCSLLLLLKNPHCSLQRLLTIPAVAYRGDSMATARIQMSNFERLLTRLKGQSLENHSCRDELDLISIEFYHQC